MNVDDELNITQTPAQICRRCGAKNDAATETHNDKVSPKPGAFSICLNCGCISRFTQTLHLEEARDVDMRELQLEDVLRLYSMSAKIKARGPLPTKEPTCKPTTEETSPNPPPST